MRDRNEAAWVDGVSKSMTPEKTAKEILDLAIDIEMANGDGKVDTALLMQTLRWVKRNHPVEVVTETRRLIESGYKGK